MAAPGSKFPYPATVLPPTGEMRVITLPSNETERLQKLKDLVGGNIEVVPLRGARYLVINENAKDSACRPNDFATWLALESESIAKSDYIAGVAVIVNAAALS